jgi:hypothetical protein
MTLEKKMKQCEEGVDFNYVIPETEDTTVGIKLLSGEYIGTIYQYGKVKFEEEKDGAIYLQFVYNVLESPLEKKILENDMNFRNHIGDILVSIMSQNIDKGIIDEVGTDYSEEPDSK